ncbi:conserved hypothetical protein [Leishmania major strain Friedlin]|uniref:RING-type domain-containing protein n=1 Tax=Leishmania major TaxID=5664 RepID=Q4Q977_LEIMA|nr:conserved hypothetical protein [Leishmania major strain Friedlin]CAG9576438.1 Ring_finger_domain/Zinc_finger_-_C3HC4_type_(RING_finger)_containing_protein_-_putative [Leishmania major strain Friedlin]CAJ05149.1 conserved hypothetical protein [Leishmania major strain Friedlin]|eukprot:XP_001684121.1 conserved hypothetical protein [Leishmania major strain Friedlin]
MLLHEALVHTECPICLQPLDYRLRPPPSRPASPPSFGTSTVAATGSETTSSTTASGHSPRSPLQLSGSNASGRAGEFCITFAPGVYGSDATDPWRPSLAVLSPASPHEAPSPSGQHIVAHSELCSPFSGRGADLSGSGHTANSSSDEGAAGVVVLPCGHLLHYLCAMQLCEYAIHPSCPVCRLKLASGADLILFRPQLRVSLIAAAQASSGVSFDGVYIEGEHNSAISVRKRSRLEEAEREDDHMQCTDGHLADGEDTSSVQACSPQSGSQRGCVPGPAVAHTSTSQSGGELSAPLLILGDDLEPTDTCAAPKTQGSPATSRQSSGGDADANQGEDDIMIIGARQLPPSQAYAELLLRTTATWAARAETLKARVEHLERSQQLLQSDCTELERTLTVARRRREVLLNLPSSKDEQDALPSAQRLRELRRLCLETRTAMSSTTTQLAEAVRGHAEVRRQTEKYMRKLSRLESGTGIGRAGGDTTTAAAAKAGLPPPLSRRQPPQGGAAPAGEAAAAALDGPH